MRFGTGLTPGLGLGADKQYRGVSRVLGALGSIHFKSSARVERVCDHCINNGAGTTECEDEYHVVFQCPLYADCRDKYTQLFVTADDLKKFLEYRDKKVLVDFFWNICKVRRGNALLC